ncbi:MAG: helix-turn-helix transcriptional regulator [Alphaproteobacteria bacterium]|nr:helix-turn-helix transcriptional regulator [Alphaproteobacteria bacterium]
MSTREVAEYLRIKERKVYALVREKRIPCTRVTGKWLFPRHLIDLWVAQGTRFPNLREAVAAPPVVVGSHDPLLEWCLRESGCELAMMSGGSLDGLGRVTAGEAVMCGLHVLDAGEGTGDAYNVAVVRDSCSGLGMVLIEWAWRQQGLVLAPGNPLGITSLRDLRDKKAGVVARQHEAGSRLLFEHLLREAGLKPGDLAMLEHRALSETDLGLEVAEGKADAGLAVAAVAHQLRLDFVPLHRERYDLLLRRRDYFEEPVQKLLAFSRTPAFQTHAAEMGGYDVDGLGRVTYNG